MDAEHMVPEVTPRQAEELARSGALLLDVREPDEWSAGHIIDARHVPLGELIEHDLPDEAGDRVVVCTCRSGNRSAQAVGYLRRMGVDARNLAGGMRAWALEGLPYVDDRGDPGQVI